MAVILCFGLPGCGKTTLVAKFALNAARGRRYQHVYTNVKLSVPGVTVVDNNCIGKYDLSNSLILIDEATLFADSRDHKNFPRHLLEFFLLHRHYNCDIVLFTQQWDGVDRKIRCITDRVYYVYKTPILGKWWTTYYRIPYGIIIPDPKGKDNNNGSKLGEIVQGYCKPNVIVRLLAPKMFRPFYYKYFDSWERPALPPLPDRYKPNEKAPRMRAGAAPGGLWKKVCNLFQRKKK